MGHCLHTLYQQAYSVLANVTPLPMDCGVICASRCCHGDEAQGMILFPGEREFLQDPSFLQIQIRQMQGRPVDFAVCSGRCPRNRRPLSCRIFPFAPYLSRDGLSVIADPRARYICPLLQRDVQGEIQKEFIGAIHRSFSILLNDQMIFDFLLLYSQMLDEYHKFA